MFSPPLNPPHPGSAAPRSPINHSSGAGTHTHTHKQSPRRPYPHPRFISLPLSLFSLAGAHSNDLLYYTVRPHPRPFLTPTSSFLAQMLRVITLVPVGSPLPRLLPTPRRRFFTLQGQLMNKVLLHTLPHPFLLLSSTPLFTVRAKGNIYKRR